MGSVAGVQEAVTSKTELDDESARFLAELDAAAAQFSTTSAVEAPAVVDAPVAAGGPGTIDAGFEGDGENIG
ncbi:hypothetical protein, partial [Stenotrophomonas sp. GbtcB23]|uniref:hypothetical protein n=1 Tax=Stenotrophomonas sp. GbtcB23 TaxID=2824768 RepID=UPI001C30D4F1